MLEFILLESPLDHLKKHGLPVRTVVFGGSMFFFMEKLLIWTKDLQLTAKRLDSRVTLLLQLDPQSTVAAD
jgi:hypothetical protein